MLVALLIIAVYIIGAAVIKWAYTPNPKKGYYPDTRQGKPTKKMDDVSYTIFPPPNL